MDDSNNFFCFLTAHGHNGGSDISLRRPRETLCPFTLLLCWVAETWYVFWNEKNELNLLRCIDGCTCNCAVCCDWICWARRSYMDGWQHCQLGASEDHDSDAFVSKRDRDIILWRSELYMCTYFSFLLLLASVLQCAAFPLFVSADIGGFLQDPEPELLVRWYQAAALQPFFRGHSSMWTKRREPWLFGEDVTAAIRTVIQQRYFKWGVSRFHTGREAGIMGAVVVSIFRKMKVCFNDPWRVGGFVTVLSLLYSGTVCCRSGTLCSTRLTPLVCLHSG